MVKSSIICVICGFLIIGCQFQPAPPPPEPKLQLESQLVSVKQIKESRQHQVVGYLEEEAVKVSESRPPHKRFKVKNKFLKLVGLVLETGHTYQYDSAGNAIKIGNYTLEIGIRKILGIEQGRGLYFEDFEPSPVFED